MALSERKTQSLITLNRTEPVKGEADVGLFGLGGGDQFGHLLHVHVSPDVQTTEHQTFSTRVDHHADVLLHGEQLHVGVHEVPGPWPDHGEAGDGDVLLDDCEEAGGGGEASLREGGADLEPAGPTPGGVEGGLYTVDADLTTLTVITTLYYQHSLVPLSPRVGSNNNIRFDTSHVVAMLEI